LFEKLKTLGAKFRLLIRKWDREIIVTSSVLMLVFAGLSYFNNSERNEAKHHEAGVSLMEKGLIIDLSEVPNLTIENGIITNRAPLAKKSDRGVTVLNSSPQTPTNSSSKARSEWVVQVASQTSPEAVQAAFTRLRSEYAILQKRAMAVQRAHLNGTTYYRVRVQTPSKDDAIQLCSDLTAQGGSCFVTR